MKSSLKIVGKTKINFLLSRTLLFFFKQKYILLLETYFFKIPISSAIFFAETDIKKHRYTSAKPQYLPTAEANFECCTGKTY